MAQSRRVKRDESLSSDVPDAARATHENALRIATGLAAWAFLTGEIDRPIITTEIAKWSVAYAVRSFNLLLEAIKGDAFSKATEQLATDLVAPIERLFVKDTKEKSLLKHQANRTFHFGYIDTRRAKFRDHPDEVHMALEKVAKYMAGRLWIVPAEGKQSFYYQERTWRVRPRWPGIITDESDDTVKTEAN